MHVLFQLRLRGLVAQLTRLFAFGLGLGMVEQGMSPKREPGILTKHAWMPQAASISPHLLAMMRV
jgi:hypothetical protein